MEAKFQTKVNTLQDNVYDLPILKNFAKSDIVTKVDSFRKGEKNLFWFISSIRLQFYFGFIIAYFDDPRSKYVIQYILVFNLTSDVERELYIEWEKEREGPM